MRKLFAFIFAALTVLCLNVPFAGTAEAAKVAIVPIEINEQQVERAGDFTGYYWDIMVEKFKYPDFDLIDDDTVSKVIPEDGLKDFSKDTLMDVARRTGADIVVAMRLDKVTDRALNFRREPALECVMRGEYASYNRVTGNYYNKNIRYKEEIEEVLTYRTDWQQKAFARMTSRYVDRTIAVR